jgi:hypothetical protein
MARPATEKEQQPMIRHVSNERQPTTKSPTREEIERRAYELYLARCCADGYAVEDWLQAEQELQARQPRT